VFVDHIKVFARAGKGGNGIVHFHRGKYRPKGGPDGGYGGKGGDVLLVVDNSTDSLRNFFYNGRLIAEDGQAGQGELCFGKAGKDAIFKEAKDGDGDFTLYAIGSSGTYDFDITNGALVLVLDAGI